MTIELIAIDLDGTLLKNDKTISPRVKDTLIRAKAKGIKVVICTGRPLPGVTNFLKELNLQEAGDYVITYNGALVQKADDGTAIAHHTMSFDNFLEVEAMSRKIGVHCQTLDKNAIYTSNKDISNYTVRESSLVNMPIKYRRVEEMNPSLVISKMMMVDEPKVLDAGIAQIPPTFYEKYTVLKSE
ncbi:MAG: HAD-IIB family hydrolase, partial [Carnobacterium sp.]|nr:HAD-IIB family hydrolase [Carnobacterium sp.]